MQRRSFLKLAGICAAGLGVGVLPTAVAPVTAAQPLLDAESPPTSRLTKETLEKIYAELTAEGAFSQPIHRDYLHAIYRKEYCLIPTSYCVRIPR